MSRPMILCEAHMRLPIEFSLFAVVELLRRPIFVVESGVFERAFSLSIMPPECTYTIS